jgi:RimJ/RimL family protein N-acetyltransferase
VIETVPTLEGKIIRLRPQERADAALFVRWWHDPEVLHWLHLSEGPEITQESWLKAYESRREDASYAAWIIETKDGLPVGQVGLHSIDPIHTRASLFISIGEKDQWGRGIGSDAVRLVLSEAFNRYDLRRVELITDADNARGIRCYEKCGFVSEGTLRAHRLRYGKPLDMITMAVLRDGWDATENR